ncbi:reverse transcriptase domain-containing protein [Tanacetum coccineum]
MDIRMSRLEKMISEKNVTTPATVKAVMMFYEDTPVLINQLFKTTKDPRPISGNNFKFESKPWNILDFIKNNQGQVFQPPTNQPPVYQVPPYQAPTPQIQGVSKMDFENYVKANDAVLKNVQNQDSASTSNSGTLPSQTVTNPRQQINAITTRSRKTLEGPSTPLVPTPVVSNLQKEPEQNPETSTEKVQNPNLENTAHVPPPEEERIPFHGDSNPNAKKTVMLKFKILILQDLIQIGLKDALVEMPKFNKWLSSLLRNKEKLEEIAITTKLGLEALTPTRMMTLELANCSITHLMGIAEDVVVRVDGFTFLADFVVVNFEPDQRVPIILGRPFLRTAKALIDLYEETLTLRIGKEELVYYADKSKKNKEKKFVHAISIIDFSKDDPFSGSTTIPSDAPFPSFSPMKTSNSTFEEFIDEFTLPNSLPPGNDDSIHKKDIHEETFSNPLFEFDDNFKSSNVNPLFEENDKDVEMKSSFSFTLTSPEESELEAYLERDSIPPGNDLTLPPTLEVLSSNPTSPTLTEEKVCSWKTPMFFSLIRFVWRMMTRIAIRKKIICLLATFLNKKPKPLSRPQAAQEEIKEKENEVSSDVPINTIVMPIRITFDNPIDFNDNFSKPKDFKKDLTVTFDSTKSSIFPPPLLDSDSPFTAELSASITLNSLGNEDKVFKPGILVYHAIHDKNLVTLEKNLRENISSGTLLFLKEPSFPRPPPKPPDVEKCFEPEAGILITKVFKGVSNPHDFMADILPTLPTLVSDLTFILFFSFRSENFVFDPGIVTFHKPVACSMKVSCSKCCSP